MKRLCIVFMLCCYANCFASVTTSGALTDFGDEQTSVLKQLTERQAVNFHWAQFGDSHTAGEYFTGELRRQLQNRLGDGGPGWFYPGYVKQQRFEAAKISSGTGWDVMVFRQNSAAGGAVGGIEGTSAKADAGYSLSFKQALLQSTYHAKILLQPLRPWLALEPELIHIGSAGVWAKLLADQNALEMSWQVLAAAIQNPDQELTIKVPQPQSLRVAGLWLDRQEPGAKLDAMGINGAKVETAAQWDAASMAAWLQERQPQLVTLAYGTNEALDPQFSAHKFSDAMQALIKLIRRHSQAAILLIGPPDLYMPPKRVVKQTVKLPNGKKKTVNKKVKVKVSCDAALPPSYEAVQKTIKLVATKEKTLYWDWQQAMGGRCSMREASQESPPLSQGDGVHMTAEGYVTYARLLWSDLLHIAGSK